jgi:hypothetical protein
MSVSLFFSGVGLQVLRVLCRLDAVELQDLAKIIYIVKGGGDAGAMKRLVEGVYKLYKIPYRNVDRNQVMNVLLDYYVLLEKKYSLAQDLVDSIPAFAATSITLMCLTCIELVVKINDFDARQAAAQRHKIRRVGATTTTDGADGDNTNSDSDSDTNGQTSAIAASIASSSIASSIGIRDVLLNAASFTEVVLRLKFCLISPSYGRPIVATDESSGSDDDSDSSDGERGGGRSGRSGSRYRKRNRTRALSSSMDLTNLPAKREISSVLTTLGTAVRAFAGRRRGGRVTRANSDYSSNNSNSNISSRSSTSEEVDGNAAHFLAVSAADSDRVVGYAIDVHALSAAYLHAMGEVRQGRKEMQILVDKNGHLPRAHIANYRYLCRLHPTRIDDIAASIDQMASADSSSKEAMYLSILMFKIHLSKGVRGGRGGGQSNYTEFTMISKRRRVVDVLSTYIEVMPPILLPTTGSSTTTSSNSSATTTTTTTSSSSSRVTQPQSVPASDTTTPTTTTTTTTPTATTTTGTTTATATVFYRCCDFKYPFCTARYQDIARGSSSTSNTTSTNTTSTSTTSATGTGTGAGTGTDTHTDTHADTHTHTGAGAGAAQVVYAWTAWRALASLLGPLSGEQQLAAIANTIYVSEASDFYRLMDRDGLLNTLALAGIQCKQGGSSSSSSSSSSLFDRRNIVQNHFEVSRRWWKSSVLSWYTIPHNYTLQESFIFDVMYQVQRLERGGSTYDVDHSLDWLDDASNGDHGNSNTAAIEQDNQVHHLYPFISYIYHHYHYILYIIFYILYIYIYIYPNSTIC